jgi:flavin-binding protein dodecin
MMHLISESDARWHIPASGGRSARGGCLERTLRRPRGHGRSRFWQQSIQQTEVQMSVAKVTEITASSTKGFDDAMRVGIQRASQTLDKIQGAWVKEQKVVCDGENITEYRVTMKVTFVLK